MNKPKAPTFFLPLLATLLVLGLPATRAAGQNSSVEVIVSVAEQRMILVQDGTVLKKLPVSTSKFGVGDGFGSYKTPLGRMRVCSKLGASLPEGAVFKSRNPTGEILAANARGRDPIVTRILWLEGEEASNQNARERCIYIHGTPQESRIGRPASYGCIRMRSRDVVDVFNSVPVGTMVTIISDKLPRFQKSEEFVESEILLADNRSHGRARIR